MSLLFKNQFRVELIFFLVWLMSLTCNQRKIIRFIKPTDKPRFGKGEIQLLCVSEIVITLTRLFVSLNLVIK